MNRGPRGFEEDLAARLKPRVDQVLHHFMLAVHRDGPSAREPVQIDAMSAAVEAQFDTMMNQPFAPHSLAHARFVEQVHRALFEDARPYALLHVLARLLLDHDGVDAMQVEQMRENQPGRAASNDTNLRAKSRGSRHEFALQTRSTTIAMPCPTPIHIAHSA